MARVRILSGRRLTRQSNLAILRLTMLSAGIPATEGNDDDDTSRLRSGRVQGIDPPAMAACRGRLEQLGGNARTLVGARY